MSLPTPGSGDYMPTLIRVLLEKPSLEEWQFDPNLFSLVFLSLIVRKGGVILDLPTSSRSSGMDVVDGLHGICESIFGLDTRHLYLDPTMPPSRIQGYIQNTDGTRRKRSRRSYHQTNLFTTPQSDISAPRPGMTIFSTPESGVSTRYHSAESLLTGGTPGTHTTPTITDAIQKSETPNVNLQEEQVEPWPDVLVVTGLEECESPLQMKLIDLVKISKQEKGEEMLVIWVRNEGKSDNVPAWLADNFILSDTILLEDLEPVPDLPCQALIPSEYIKGLTALLPYTHIHAPITQHLNNLISAAATHPNLHSSMTARFFTTLPLLVKAHRLLSSPYILPPDWRENLARSVLPGGGKVQRFGLGGGQGGVNDWPRKAGEEPNVQDLGDGAVEWYVGPANVRGVWLGAVGHRLRWRDSGQSVMWVMKTSAAGLLKGMREDEKEGDETKRNKRGAKMRIDVKRIVEEMLEMV